MKLCLDVREEWKITYRKLNAVIKHSRIVFEIFRKKWEKKICHPLHCVGFYLNPKFFYKIPAEKIDSDEAYRVVKEGLYKAMERLIPDPKDYDQEMFGLRTYTDAARSLGSASDIYIYDWWILHGVGVPCLQKFAIRVLSLTVSASPCERNWSTFENLYSKKRNKFLKHKLSESIFIQYNKNLQRRYEEENKYSGDEDAYRPIFLEAFDENDDWIIPQGGGLVREGEDLTWEQDNAASGDMDVGPSTRLRRKERSDTHPTFSLLSEEPDDEYLPPI
ncbi:uncharacterized protein LOC113277419 isoform X1 [Papaver somniferum]|uniref:uncharacterized protein LOC113277419 isoform X1 n=1 Tax=Papaver somniferum TaxID=3469 RepID=UPI000E6F8DDC|nr:uncharacterized protein LOC113277419 isoform X1 [Papaver somniferum]